MPNIRMVWFDIGRVLYDHFADELLDDLAAHSNPPIKPHEVYGRIKKSKLVVRYDRGELSNKDFTDEMQSLLGFTDRQWFLSHWQRVLMPNPLVWRLVLQLLKNSYPLGIISNICELHVRRIETTISSGAIMQFRPRIYSCREGVDKPNSEIFRIALAKANEEYSWPGGLCPSECVFIDDLLENGEAARAQGWYTIHHNPVFVTKTVLQLAELGVRI